MSTFQDRTLHILFRSDIVPVGQLQADNQGSYLHNFLGNLHGTELGSLAPPISTVSQNLVPPHSIFEPMLLHQEYVAFSSQFPLQAK